MIEIDETDGRVTVRSTSGEPIDGKLMKSPATGNVYRVPEWKHIEGDRYRALRKEQVESVECSDTDCEADAFGLFSNGVFREPRCLDHAQGDHIDLLFTMPGKEIRPGDEQ